MSHHILGAILFLALPATLVATLAGVVAGTAPQVFDPDISDAELQLLPAGERIVRIFRPGGPGSTGFWTAFAAAFLLVELVGIVWVVRRRSAGLPGSSATTPSGGRLSRNVPPRPVVGMPDQTTRPRPSARRA